MSADNSYWTIYHIALADAPSPADTWSEVGFSGNAHQRRKGLRNKIREILPGKQIIVTKRKWKKGTRVSTATIEWVRNIQT